MTDRHKISVADYVLTRLVELQVEHVFGIAATSCADLFIAIDRRSDIEAVVTASELEAGYAVDGYARKRGFGVCAVAYGVGTLSLINAVAGCLVEKVPMLVLNGGPTQEEVNLQGRYGVLFTHATGRPETDRKTFAEVCVSAHILRPDEDIGAAIDRALVDARDQFGPAYLEVPHDMWDLEIPAPLEALPPRRAPVASARFQAFLDAALRQAAAAERPAFLLGVELVRSGLAKQALEMIEHAGYPFATTVLSKSMLPEDHPQFAGTYDTDLVTKPVRGLLEQSDCFIALGCIYGIDHLGLLKKQYDHMVHVSFGDGRLGAEKYADIDVGLFVEGFRPPKANGLERRAAAQCPDTFAERRALWAPSREPDAGALGHEGLFEAVDLFLRDSESDFVTVLDTCLGSFPGADLVMRSQDAYIANPVWLSIGHSTPAAIGSYLADKRRPLVITGDGGFQMVVQCISTMVKHSIPGIVIIIDNASYAIEQYLVDSCFFVRPQYPMAEFARVSNWNYENMPRFFGGGHGVKVSTEADLSKALTDAEAYVDGPFIISAQVPSDDLPPENLPWAQEQCPPAGSSLEAQAASKGQPSPSRWARRQR